VSGEFPEKTLVVARRRLWICVEGSGVPTALEETVLAALGWASAAQLDH